MNKQYERKVKENKPVVAICYDFDKTLTPDDMQAQGFIQSVGYDVNSFWEKSNGLAEQNEMDQNLAYMYTMLHESEGKGLFTKKSLRDYGSKIQLFPGVEEWFERIRDYAKGKGVIIEHYIISSGLKEMIEGTKVASSFERIYASSFYYNDRDVAEWPAQVVNSNGGHSIGVYNPATQKKEKVYKMMHDKRIKYFAPADYSEGSELDALVKAIIDRTYYNELLEEIHFKNKKEYELDEANFSEEQKLKKSLLLNLEESGSFRTTHTVIAELRKVDYWSPDEIDWLIDIALSNSQVNHILTDDDVARFYKSIIEGTHNKKAEELREVLKE